MSRESQQNALLIQHCYSPYRTTQFEKTIKKRQKGPVLAIKGPFGLMYRLNTRAGVLPRSASSHFYQDSDAGPLFGRAQNCENYRIVFGAVFKEFSPASDAAANLHKFGLNLSTIVLKYAPQSRYKFADKSAQICATNICTSIFRFVKM